MILIIYIILGIIVAEQIKSPPLNISDVTDEIQKALKKINVEEALSTQLLHHLQT